MREGRANTASNGLQRREKPCGTWPGTWPGTWGREFARVTRPRTPLPAQQARSESGAGGDHRQRRQRVPEHDEERRIVEAVEGVERAPRAWRRARPPRRRRALARRARRCAAPPAARRGVRSPAAGWPRGRPAHWCRPAACPSSRPARSAFRGRRPPSARSASGSRRRAGCGRPRGARRAAEAEGQHRRQQHHRELEVEAPGREGGGEVLARPNSMKNSTSEPTPPASRASGSGLGRRPGAGGAVGHEGFTSSFGLHGCSFGSGRPTPSTRDAAPRAPRPRSCRGGGAMSRRAVPRSRSP